MIGQLITSFLRGKVNLTTTSTIFSPYVDRVMEESRIAYFSESPGAILATAKARLKTGGGAYWGGHRRKLLRLRRAKHRATVIRYGWRAQLLWLRLTWKSHWQPQLRTKLALISNFRKNK